MSEPFSPQRVRPTPREILRACQQGHNITTLLRSLHGQDRNTEDIIEVAYDLQSGAYVRGMEIDAHARCRLAHAEAIAREIAALGAPGTLLEAGVGEATTLSSVLAALNLPPTSAYGFDLSWSRVAFARCWLEQQSLPGVTLCTGSLLAMPFADQSVDVVYTSHTIEPNGGREEPILRELHRVARRGLILLEPCFELADEPARARMKTHGYCRDLLQTCRRLGYDVIKHEPFTPLINPLNPTAITVIRKPEAAAEPGHILACPKFKTPLLELGGMLFSPEALAVYPVLCGIPCLRPEAAIVASRYPDFFPKPLGSPP